MRPPNLARRTRAAYLGKFKPIDRFDWAHQRKIDRALVARLVGLDFVARGDDVLLRGPSGIGKAMRGAPSSGVGRLLGLGLPVAVVALLELAA